MMKTAIILAGGYSERFGKDKALVLLAGRPLIRHVFDRVTRVVDEVLITVNSPSQKADYSKIFPRTTVLVDAADCHCPLAGALTGFMCAHGDYSLLLPCDTPFVSREVVNLLFDLSSIVDAVIPRWSNGYIEPLQAVYRTGAALSAAKGAIEKGEKRMQAMIGLLNKVRYLSTIVIQEMDSSLVTFFNVNTLPDLRKAEAYIESTS